MPVVFRLVLSILAGVLASSLVVGLVNQLRNMLYPVATVPETIQESLRAVPQKTWWLMMAGYAVCALLGAWLTARIAPTGNRQLAGMFTAFLLLLGAVFYFVLVAYPAWYAISSCGLLIFFGALGARIGTGRKGSDKSTPA